MKFAGLTRAEALELELPPRRWLVDKTIEPGTLGQIVGLPGSYKSFNASQLVFGVASGRSWLGRKAHAGPVGCWLEDGARDSAVRRTQEYARANALTGALPIRWHFAEGLLLPRDLDQIAAEVEREQQVLVVIDSAYNVVAGKLHDEDAADVLMQVKRRICDELGAVVAVIDHAPWPSESNRGQRRGYGSVFKLAAARWTVFHQRDDDGHVWIDVDGNDIESVPRREHVFDPETLRLVPVDDKPAPAARDFKAELLAKPLAVADGRWRTSEECAQKRHGGIKANRLDVETALEELVALRAVERVSPIPGRHRRSIGYRRFVQPPRTNADELPQHSVGNSSTAGHPPVGGTGWDEFDDSSSNGSKETVAQPLTLLDEERP